MSKHAKPTLVRFWFDDGDNQDAAYVLVNDWVITRADGWSEFTLPIEHPVVDKLFDCGVTVTRLLVMESEQGEWRIDKMWTARELGRDVWHVICESWSSRVRRMQPTDQWVIDNLRVIR